MSVAQHTQAPAMDALNRSNPCAGRFGALYSFYIERERLARLAARIAWGIDSRPLYASLSAVETVPEDGVILDVPCGAGLALRHLRPARRVTYLAVDLDPRMLDRVARRARRDRLGQVECLRADVARMPIIHASVDLCISHGGLHCFSQPSGALAELARSLRPGGRLLGTTFVAPGTRRQRLLFRGERRRSHLPDLWTKERLARELSEAGFTNVKLMVSAGYALFDADRSTTAGRRGR
jgi:SAM-dependent methyltransferase